MKLTKKNCINGKRIFINVVIYSIDRNNNKYEAMAIEDGVITALGEKKEILKLCTEDTEVIDLKDKIVLPGFIDANTHTLESMMLKSDQLNKHLDVFNRYQDALHSNGITAIGVIDENKDDSLLKLYKKLQNERKLKLRIINGVTIKPQSICKRTICEQLHALKRNRILYQTDLFDISMVKFYSDGTIKNMTAYLFKPYNFINDKDEKHNSGIFLWDEVEFKEGIKMANRLEFNVWIHSVGDRACKLSIDGIEYASKNNINCVYRNSLIKVDLITKYYIRKMKMLKINAIIEPFWFYKDNSLSKNEVFSIGEERAQRQYPVKSLIDMGIVTAGCSGDDESLEKGSPLKAIECSTIRNLYDFTTSGYPENIDMTDIRYRLNPNERISIIEAVKMFTINAAYLLGKEKEIGSLENGKKADFIVINKDIFKINLFDIATINIERTYFNGELVYLNE